MNLLAVLALLGWIPFVFVLFLSLPRRVALLTAVVGGWLFLPVAIIPLPGLPDYGKVSATSFAPLLAALVFDAKRVFRFRPGWRDLPVALLCLCPICSSLDNGLGVHDGISAVLTDVTIWGIPYFLGRIYLWDEEGMRLLTRAIVVGGLIYVPLCLIEIRLSPQLHRFVYGYHQHQFLQTARGSGWRPDVFMQHGLMVSFWMAVAALLAVTLTRARVLRALFGMPAAYCAAALVVTAILCKSVGAIMLLAIGAGVAQLARRRQATALLWLLLLLPPLYIAGRLSGAISEAGVTMLLSPLPKERVESIAYRMKNEDPMVERALMQPIFGWGGWGRSRLVNDEGIDVSTADSLWIQYLGRNGLVGLCAILALLFIGPFTFLQRYRPAYWLRREHAPVFGAALVVVLFGIDCTVNAMQTPVYIMAMGALVGIRRPAPAPASAPPSLAAPPQPALRV